MHLAEILATDVTCEGIFKISHVYFLFSKNELLADFFSVFFTVGKCLPKVKNDDTRTIITFVLKTCSCANVPLVLTCSSILHSYVFTWQHALHPYVLPWQCALRAYVPACLASLRVTCQHALRAYLLMWSTWLASSHASVTT